MQEYLRLNKRKKLSQGLGRRTGKMKSFSLHTICFCVDFLSRVCFLLKMYLSRKRIRNQTRLSKQKHHNHSVQAAQAPFSD